MMSKPSLTRILPQKEIVGIVLHDAVGVAGEISQPADIEPGAGWHLQHAAPCLIAQQLDLGGKEQIRVVLPRQVVVHAVRLLMDSEHFGENDDLSELCAARFSLRSPVVGKLASP